MLRYVLAILLLASTVLETRRAWADSETNTAGAQSGGTNWTDAGNITGAGDNSCAIYDDKNQNIIVGYNYGFSIPTGVTIDSIYVTLDGYGTNALAAKRQVEVQLTKSGGVGGNNPVGDLLEDVTLTQAANCGGSGNTAITNQGLWGTTWTVSQINAVTFGVIVKDDDATASELGIDAITVEVVYTPAASPRRKNIILEMTK